MLEYKSKYFLFFQEKNMINNNWNNRVKCLFESLTGHNKAE